MSKNSQNYQVALVDQDDHTQVMIADREVGRIKPTGASFTGYVGEQVVAAQAKTLDEALQAILASFNLHH